MSASFPRLMARVALLTALVATAASSYAQIPAASSARSIPTQVEQSETRVTIWLIRPSDCSTSVGLDRADEATGICAKLLAAEATSAVSKATRAIKRGKLADINTSFSFNADATFERLESHKRQHSLCAVSIGSSMIWILQDSLTEPITFGGYHTVF